MSFSIYRNNDKYVNLEGRFIMFSTNINSTYLQCLLLLSNECQDKSKRVCLVKEWNHGKIWESEEKIGLIFCITTSKLRKIFISIRIYQRSQVLTSVFHSLVSAIASCNCGWIADSSTPNSSIRCSCWMICRLYFPERELILLRFSASRSTYLVN